MNSPQTIRIKELNLDLIQPNYETMNIPEQGGSKTVVIGKPGCFAPGTKVLKYDGEIKNVEDIQIGDQLMGDDSTPRNVLELCHNFETMYKIIPEKGEPVVVNENHILSLKWKGYKRNIEGEIYDIVLKDFLMMSETYQKRFNWFRTGVAFEKRVVELDPYLFGYCLGDEEVLEKLEELELFLRQKDEDPITYRIIQTECLKHFKNNFLNFLNDNNFLQNKHIPNDYKCNSRQIRLELLAGIIDSNGSYDTEGFDIIQKSERFIDDIVFLARSLGFSAYKKECTKRCPKSEGHLDLYYRCFINGNISEVPCHIIRNQEEKITKCQDVLVTGFNIEKLEKGEYYGFVLDGNHRFLLEDFSVVHNTGKTTLIASLLYAKRNIFPVAIAMSGSEDSNGFYRKILPSTFVFNDYNEDKIKEFIRRQKIAMQHLENPWAIILLDDCTDDPRIFNKPLQHGMYKRGRHWKMWYILSLQYAMDVKPVIRTNVDGVFILREPILKNRKRLWENYASIIPDFTLFCDIMDQLTNDYTSLYIHNSSKSNDWRDCVFYYKANVVPDDFKFGSDTFWDHHYQRFNPEYIDPFM